MNMKKFLGISKIFFKNKKEEIKFYFKWEFQHSSLYAICVGVLTLAFVLLFVFAILFLMGFLAWLISLTGIINYAEYTYMILKDAGYFVEKLFQFGVASILYLVIIIACFLIFGGAILSSYYIIKNIIKFFIWIYSNIKRAIKEYEEYEE